MLFKQACRDTISDQIKHFRAVALARISSQSFICPISKLAVGRDELHVDHEPPQTFDWIVSMFVATRKIDVRAVIFGGFGDNETRTRSEDSRLRADWWLFHKTHARLRLVSKYANLSTIRKRPLPHWPRGDSL